jgi:flagellar protein FliO/FliZ
MPSRAFRSLILTLACLALAACTAHASDGEQTKLDLEESAGQAAEAASGPGGGSLVRTIVGLVVVVGVIYGLTWVLRQVKGAREAKASGAGLRMLATLPLGTNRALHLVRSGEEVVLLGAAEHGVTPIRTYSTLEARRLGLLAGEDGDEDGPDGAPASPLDDLIAPTPARGRGLIAAIRRRTVIK